MDPTVELSQMPELTANMLDLGLVGLALVILYRALGIVGQLVLAKKGYTTKGETTSARDHQYLKDIHKMTTDTERQKVEGAFKCQWQGRDEIRDLLETLRALKASVDTLTLTIQNGSRKG